MCLFVCVIRLGWWKSNSTQSPSFIVSLMYIRKPSQNCIRLFLFITFTFYLPMPVPIGLKLLKKNYTSAHKIKIYFLDITVYKGISVILLFCFVVVVFSFPSVCPSVIAIVLFRDSLFFSLHFA